MEGMVHAHCISCALYFHSYYISSTSDHQALDPGGRGLLTLRHIAELGNVLSSLPGDLKAIGCKFKPVGSGLF